MKRGTPRAWQKATRVPFVSASAEEAKEARLVAKRIAHVLGWCPSCGEHVDIDMGKLHDRWCPDAKPEHRKAS